MSSLKNNNHLSRSAALKFVLLFGLISLLADATYEGARSINGQFLAVLGASGALVGFVSGFGELIGYGIMSTGAGEAHILNLCVGSAFQGQGLGRALLTRLLEEAGSLRVDTVFLEVRPSNVPAVTLYESMGFNCIGTRKDYYPAKYGREDATILALTLCPDES